MEIHHLAGAAFPHPFQIEPVLRAARVAVEPELRPGDGTAGRGLIDEALRHQGHLVEECPGKGDALDQVLTALVLAAEKVKLVDSSALADGHAVFCPMFLDVVATGCKLLLERTKYVAPEAGNGLSTHGKLLAAVACHSPLDEREAHGKGLARADSAICNDAVVAAVCALRCPPAQDLLLPLAEGFPAETVTFPHGRLLPPAAFQRHPAG
jgi:hypothetical protein